MITETDRAYAAGLFDGEGSVLLMPGPTTARYRVRLKVELSQVETAALLWLKSHFGGRVYPLAVRSSYNARPAHRWDLCGNHAVDFLAAIRKYLLIKSRQADLAFDFYKTVTRKGGLVKPISPDVVARREQMRLEMKRLNLRGEAWLRASASVTTS